jgi:cell division protein FtsB
MPRYGVLVASVLALLCVYFNWEIRFSPRGLGELHSLTSHASDLELELTNLESQRAKFESQIALLRVESLDPDMLDEAARLQLGYVDRNDRIIPFQR